MTSTEQVDASSSSLASDGDVGEAVCYLCLDGDADEAGQQLRRDCACRGTDAGIVHLSCLAKYAATKSKQAISMNRTTCMDEFIKPWLVCPSCDQYYQNELAVDIAAEFVLFVRGHYPRDTQLQVEALHVKLCALDSMLDRPAKRREAGASANVLLSLITRMKGEMSPMPARYSQFEAGAYSTLGAIALKERTEESARRAVVHFENQIEVYEATGHSEGVATAKGNLAIAKAMYEHDNNNEEVLVTCRELYEMNVAKYGKEHAFPIDSGVKYASALQKANRGGEARALLAKLLATSNQILGSDHSTTKEVASALQRAKTNEVIEVINLAFKWANRITSILIVSILIGVLAMLYRLVK